MPKPGLDIRTLIARELDISDAGITQHTRLREDLSVDSVLALNLLFAFEKEFDVRISEEQMTKLVAVGDLESLALQILDGTCPPKP